MDSMQLMMQGLSALIDCFADTLFMSFTAMIAMSIAMGIKRLFLE
ncbi:hypothetical protein [Paenibacillus thiaminolyticus]|nr:hypothetical protein [Paenibacillus thiaminolyticus]